eukprot:c8126_g1_i1 orf=55-393(-)
MLFQSANCHHQPKTKGKTPTLQGSHGTPSKTVSRGSQRLFHLLLREEDVLLDDRVVLAKLELVGDPAGVLGLDVEVASARSRNQPYQHRSPLRLPHRFYVSPPLNKVYEVGL